MSRNLVQGVFLRDAPTRKKYDNRYFYYSYIKLNVTTI